MIQNIDNSFTFYYYISRTSPAGVHANINPVQATYLEHELDVTKMTRWHKPIVYLSPDQINRLPETVKINKAFISFLSACNFMVPKEILPPGLPQQVIDQHTEDAQQAMILLEKSAAEGYAPAQNMLAVCYNSGYGTNVDKMKSLTLFEQAAAEGFAPAQNNMAVCWEKGLGVVKDLTKAASLFKKAADQGYIPAQNSFGHCLKNGSGVNMNLKEAVSYLSKAANEGHPAAQTSLALCLLNGDGIKKDLDTAITWLKKAVRVRYAEAQFHLGFHYLNSPTTIKIGVVLLQKAAVQGNEDALTLLSLCYQNSIGVDQNLTKAADLLKQATNKDHVHAMTSLAHCYQNGIGVERDFEMAATLFHRAAEKGFSPAQHALGVCYQHGLGVIQSIDSAIFFFEAAAKQNYELAIQNLHELKNNEKTEITAALPTANAVVSLDTSEGTREEIMDPNKRVSKKRKQSIKKTKNDLNGDLNTL